MSSNKEVLLVLLSLIALIGKSEHAGLVSEVHGRHLHAEDTSSSPSSLLEACYNKQYDPTPTTFESFMSGVPVRCKYAGSRWAGPGYGARGVSKPMPCWLWQPTSTPDEAERVSRWQVVVWCVTNPLTMQLPAAASMVERQDEPLPRHHLYHRHA